MDNIPYVAAWRSVYTVGFGYETPDAIYRTELALTDDPEHAEQVANEYAIQDLLMRIEANGHDTRGITR